MSAKTTQRENIRRIIEGRFSRLDPQGRREWVRFHQGMLHAMIGESILASTFVENPTAAYVDQRVGRLAYPRRTIETARLVLIEAAIQAGMDPTNLDYPVIYSCGPSRKSG